MSSRCLSTLFGHLAIMILFDLRPFKVVLQNVVQGQAQNICASVIPLSAGSSNGWYVGRRWRIATLNVKMVVLSAQAPFRPLLGLRCSCLSWSPLIRNAFRCFIKFITMVGICGAGPFRRIIRRCLASNSAGRYWCNAASKGTHDLAG
jgi:hypothetical protein